MHELYCPNCNTPSPYTFGDYLLMCPFCSGTFKFDMETGQKEPFSDHFIVPNMLDAGSVKELAIEWLKRLHHKPGMVSKEFFVVDIQGFSVPLWVVSLEAHTTWKGLVRKAHGSRVTGSDYLHESGLFRRSYRWAILARSNICESWGLSRLHLPSENVPADWDGFPLDSTLSRGRLVEAPEGVKQVSAYDSRKFFEFKFANGLPILGVQVAEDEAMRRAKFHVNQYHMKLATLNVTYLTDHRTELEIAGIQLIHTPFWRATYVYRPKTILRHFIKPVEKHLLLDGYGMGVLSGETAIKHTDKVVVNAIVCGIASVFFLILGVLWHPAFHIVAIFAMIVAAISVSFAIRNKSNEETEALRAKSESFSAKLEHEEMPNSALVS